MPADDREVRGISPFSLPHISVQEMIDIYMVTFLAGIQTCPLGPSPLCSNSPLGPSPLGSNGPLGPFDNLGGWGKQGEGRWLHVPDDLVQGQGRGRRITITMSIGSITLFDTIMSLLLLCLVFALSRRDRSVITAGLSYMYCA